MHRSNFNANKQNVQASARRNQYVDKERSQLWKKTEPIDLSTKKQQQQEKTEDIDVSAFCDPIECSTAYDPPQNPWSAETSRGYISDMETAGEEGYWTTVKSTTNYGKKSCTSHAGHKNAASKDCKCICHCDKEKESHNADIDMCYGNLDEAVAEKKEELWNMPQIVQTAAQSPESTVSTHGIRIGYGSGADLSLGQYQDEKTWSTVQNESNPNEVHALETEGKNEANAHQAGFYDEQNKEVWNTAQIKPIDRKKKFSLTKRQAAAYQKDEFYESREERWNAEKVKYDGKWRQAEKHENHASYWKSDYTVPVVNWHTAADANRVKEKFWNNVQRNKPPVDSSESSYVSEHGIRIGYGSGVDISSRFFEDEKTWSTVKAANESSDVSQHGIRIGYGSGADISPGQFEDEKTWTTVDNASRCLNYEEDGAAAESADGARKDDQNNVVDDVYYDQNEEFWDAEAAAAAQAEEYGDELDQAIRIGYGNAGTNIWAEYCDDEKTWSTVKNDSEFERDHGIRTSCVGGFSNDVEAEFFNYQPDEFWDAAQAQADDKEICAAAQKKTQQKKDEFWNPSTAHRNCNCDCAAKEKTSNWERCNVDVSSECWDTPASKNERTTYIPDQTKSNENAEVIIYPPRDIVLYTPKSFGNKKAEAKLVQSAYSKQTKIAASVNNRFDCYAIEEEVNEIETKNNDEEVARIIATGKAYNETHLKNTAEMNMDYVDAVVQAANAGNYNYNKANDGPDCIILSEEYLLNKISPQKCCSEQSFDHQNSCNCQGKGAVKKHQDVEEYWDVPQGMENAYKAATEADIQNKKECAEEKELPKEVKKTTVAKPAAPEPLQSEPWQLPFSYDSARQEMAVLRERNNRLCWEDIEMEEKLKELRNSVDEPKPKRKGQKPDIYMKYEDIDHGERHFNSRHEDGFDPSMINFFIMEDSPCGGHVRNTFGYKKTSLNGKGIKIPKGLKNQKPHEYYIPPLPTENEAEIFNSGIKSGKNFNKYDNIPIKISGKRPPEPLASFDDAFFLAPVISNIAKSKYDVPTPIQKTAIPVIAARRDLMACAQTGSGKTAAYLLPIINELLEDCRACGMGKPQALVISPTRELTVQIFNEARKFAFGTRIRVSVIYGGTSTKYQGDSLARGSHLLICTPGRLMEFLAKRFISLENTRYVVLDEADRMMDMGFKDHINLIMHHQSMNQERQTLMFSATFPNDIQQLASEYLKNYIFIAIGAVGGACRDVTQTFHEVPKHKKRLLIRNLLQDNCDDGGIIVFVETKGGADFLASLLSETLAPTTSIHGDRLQSQRESALADFKSGKMKILIATSVASRGLDIKGVHHVINYDLPNTVDEYVHRIGRTGRMGNSGRATSFFDPAIDHRIAPDLIRVLKDAGQQVPAFLAQGDGNANIENAPSEYGGDDVRGQQVHTRQYSIRKNGSVNYDGNA